MTFPISLLLQVATRPTPTIKTSLQKGIGSNKNLDLPKIELKQNRPKYDLGWTDYREVMKNGD